MVDLPGLPALPGAISDLFEDVSLIAGDAISVFLSDNTEQWGIFLNGEPVVLADNVISFDYKEDWSTSTYPIEQGSFGTYNKVQRPFSVRVRFSTGGSPSDRQAFLQSIASIIGDTNLYDVVTPEITYSSVTLVHQDYRRTANSGAGLISIDVSCEQVRATSTAQFSTSQSGGINSPQSPTSSPQANGGSVQPSDAPASFSDRFTFN